MWHLPHLCAPSSGLFIPLRPAAFNRDLKYHADFAFHFTLVAYDMYSVIPREEGTLFHTTRRSSSEEILILSISPAAARAERSSFLHTLRSYTQLSLAAIEWKDICRATVYDACDLLAD
jgi:hypothetical protein